MVPSIPKVEKRLVASLLARGPTGFALAVEGAAPVWAFGPSEFKPQIYAMLCFQAPVLKPPKSNNTLS